MTIQEIIRCCLDVLVGGFCLVVCGVLCVGGARFVERRLLAAVVEAGRRCGMQVASALLAVSLVCTVVAQKGGDTNSPPEGVSGTNTVEQIRWGQSPWNLKTADNEVQARKAEESKLTYYVERDWCNPGCQSRVRRGPNVDESEPDEPDSDETAPDEDDTDTLEL